MRPYDKKAIFKDSDSADIWSERLPILLEAPTGSGKTTWLMEKLITTALPAVYTVPLRALAAEIYDRWKDTGLVRLAAGETAKGAPNAPVLITTPEKFSMILRSWKRHLSYLYSLDTVVVDEAHLIEKPGRGPVLELMIHHTRRLLPFTRLVLSSATLSPSPLHHMLSALLVTPKTLSGISPSSNVDISFIHCAAQERKNHLETLVRQYHDRRIIIFVHSRHRARDLAAWLSTKNDGVRFHHAGLSHAVRTATEQDFRTGAASILVATPTLEMGVNLPADVVILYDSYISTPHGWALVSPRDILQRAGRAGRFSGQGHAIVFAPQDKPEYSQWLIEHLPPLKSALDPLTFVQTELGTGLSVTTAQLKRAAQTLPLASFGETELTAVLRDLAEKGLIELTDSGRIHTGPVLRSSTRMLLNPLPVLDFISALHRLDSKCPDCSTGEDSDQRIHAAMLLGLALASAPLPHLAVTDLVNSSTPAPAALSGRCSTKLECEFRRQFIRLCGQGTMSGMIRTAILAHFWHGRVRSHEWNATVSYSRRMIALAGILLSGHVSSWMKKALYLAEAMTQGLAGQALYLLELKGIGPKRAVSFWEKWQSGRYDELPESVNQQLSELKDIKTSPWPKELTDFLSYLEEAHPRLLFRSMNLRVSPVSDDVLEITGGSQTHYVTNHSCDCFYHAQNGICKHSTAARIYYFLNAHTNVEQDITT